jgi:hypothetical protein
MVANSLDGTGSEYDNDDGFVQVTFFRMMLFTDVLPHLSHCIPHLARMIMKMMSPGRKRSLRARCLLKLARAQRAPLYVLYQLQVLMSSGTMSRVWLTTATS